jgi:FixJ family two-component response regulator
MTRENLSIAVVDDDPAMCRSVARVLSSGGFSPVTYSSPRSLLEEIDTLRPGCVVADLSMPELTGLELQRRLAARDLDYPIVFISGHGDIRSSVQAMRGGAVDFLPKPFEASALLEAVDRALARSVAARAVSARLAELQRRVTSLTRRERQVFAQVVEGSMNKQIAASLGIAEKTVKVHRARVMRKMGARSVAELARLAERIGMGTGN